MSSSQSKDAKGTGTGAKKALPKLGPEFVISWGWLIGGIVAAVVFVGGVALTHAYQMSRLPDYIIQVADRIIDEADQFEKDQDYLMQNRKLQEAVDVLSRYREMNSKKSMPELTKRLAEIQARRYENGNVSPKDLIKILEWRMADVESGEQKEVRERILQLQWDSGNIVGVLTESRNLLVSDKDNPVAWRLLARARYRQLAETGVYRSENPEPPEIDKLLEKAYLLNANDIDIASSYAEMLSTKNATVLSFFSGENLLSSRKSKADSVINKMVDANRNDPKAYLSRFEYRNTNGELNFSQDKMDPDLEQALKLDPNNINTLVLAGIYDFQRAMRYKIANNEDAYQKLSSAAEERFRTAAQLNPLNEIPYQQLGDMFEAQGNMSNAVKEWKNGYERIRITKRNNPELVGRLVRGLIQVVHNDEAKDVLKFYRQLLKDNPLGIPSLQTQCENMCNLLEGQLCFLDDEGIAQNPITRAMQHYRTFERNLDEFYFPANSVLPRILGESFMMYGEYMMNDFSYDEAAWAFKMATKFPAQRLSGTLAQVNALHADNKTQDAIDLLRAATKEYPVNAENPDDPKNKTAMLIHFQLAQLLFQNAKNVDPQSNPELKWTELLNEVDFLTANKNSIPDPWAIDLFKIRVLYEKGGDTINTQTDTLRSMRLLLRSQTVPDPATGAKRQPHLAFLNELASMFSALGSPEDLRNVLDIVADDPNGKVTSLSIQINDAIRRDAKDEALEIARQAVDEFPQNSPESLRFQEVADRLQPRPENTDPEVYITLGEIVAELLESPNPQVKASPQALFEYAEMALDREALDVAKPVEDLIKASEGEDGVRWRYIKARRLAMEAEPGNKVQLEEAQKIQTHIAGRRPDWDKGYILLALIKTKEGDVPSAIEAYRTAINRGCRQPEVYQTLIDLLVNQNLLAEADDVRRRAMRNNIPIDNTGTGRFGQPYQQYYEQIYKAINDKDLDSADRWAEDCINMAKEREPAELVLDLNAALGKLFMDFDHLEKAKKFLEDYANVGGKNVYPLAVCLAKNKEWDAAFNLLLDEIEKTPDNPILLPATLVLLTQIKPNEPSEEVFQRLDSVLKRNGENLIGQGGSSMDNPEFIKALLPLADYWIVRENPDEAISLYDAGLKREPNNLIIVNNLAYLHSAKGDHQKGLALIDAALGKAPEQPTLLDTKGLILVANGQPEEALPLMERACELTCEGPLFVMHYAYALLKSGDIENARMQFFQVSPLINRDRQLKEDQRMFDELSNLGTL